MGIAVEPVYALHIDRKECCRVENLASGRIAMEEKVWEITRGQ